MILKRESDLIEMSALNEMLFRLPNQMMYKYLAKGYYNRYSVYPDLKTELKELFTCILQKWQEE